MNGNPHPPGPIEWWMGDSRGRWEDHSLVVDVTHFNDQTWFDRAGNFHSSALHVVERYTLTGPNHMLYEVTIEDSTVWTGPWTIRQELKRQSNMENRIYYEPRCHEGNYGLPALLIGSRLDEQAFEEGRGPDPFSFSIFDAAALQRP